MSLLSSTATRPGSHSVQSGLCFNFFEGFSPISLTLSLTIYRLLSRPPPRLSLRNHETLNLTVFYACLLLFVSTVAHPSILPFLFLFLFQAPRA